MAIEFRYDPASRNGMGMGAWDTDLNAFVVTCEGCNEIVGKGATLGDAEDDAMDNDGYRDSSDEGSGDLYCRPCVDAAYREGMAQAAQYDAEMRLRQMREDDEAWRDSILSDADARFDAARDRGEV